MEETAVSRIRRSLRNRLCVDTRALAGFRVTLGVALLVDLTMRARGVTVFYTDAGVLPRDVLAQTFPALARLSLHALSGGVLLQVLLLAVSFIATFALLIGFRSRVAAAVSLVLIVSMYARNPFVLNGGDTMLVVLLLLASLLPIGARWSVDTVARTTERTDGDTTVFSAPGVAALLFLVVIYSSNAVLRYRGKPWMSGEAVRRVFELETVTVLLGPYLAELPVLLEGINWIWVAMLTLSPLLLVLTGRLRAAFAGAFVVAHAAMAVTLRLGVFPVVVIAALVLFLPPVFWNRVDDVLNGGVEWVGSAVPDSTTAFASGSSLGGRLGSLTGLCASIVAVILLLAVVVWQGAALGYVDAPDVGADPDEYAWKMYSPTPQTTYGWYAVDAETSSGRHVDGLHGGGVTDQPPPNLADSYPTTLWYRYLSDLNHASDLRQNAFAEYVCSKTPGAEKVEVRYHEREVVLNGEDEERTVDVVTHDCT